MECQVASSALMALPALDALWEPSFPPRQALVSLAWKTVPNAQVNKVAKSVKMETSPLVNDVIHAIQNANNV